MRFPPADGNGEDKLRFFIFPFSKLLGCAHEPRLVRTEKADQAMH